MASSSGKLSIRLLILVLLLLAAFYIGHPLYWKLSATIHEIREKRQTVKEGFLKFVLDAQKSVGLVHDESDAGFVDEQHSGKATTQRILRPLKNKICESPHSPDGLVGLETEKSSSLDFTLSSSQEGITNTVGAVPGIVGVALTGYLLDSTHSWSMSLFAPSIFFYLTGTVVWLALASSNPQRFSKSD